jgi:hypothetical protein
MRPHLPTACLGAVVFLVASGCDLKKLAVDQTADVLKVGAVVFDTERDPELARAAIPASLKTMESFLAANPEQAILLELLAAGYTNYAFGFIEDEAEVADASNPSKAATLRGRALDYYLRGRDYGLRLLAEDAAELAEALQRGQAPTPEALAELGQDQMPALFWTANSWAAAINAGKDRPELLAQLQIVRTLVERAAEIDPTYFHAGPIMTLGALEAALPRALGGKPEVATKHFERADALNQGRFLMIRVLYARAVLTQLGDKAAFAATLEKVIAADPDAEPTAALANRLAQTRARRYLAAASDFFLE